MSVVEFFREHPATDEAGKTFTQAWERDGKKESTFLAFVRKVMDAGSRGCSELAPRSARTGPEIPVGIREAVRKNLEAVCLGATIMTVLHSLKESEWDLKFFSNEVNKALSDSSLKIAESDDISNIGLDEYRQITSAAQGDMTLAVFFKNDGKLMSPAFRNYLKNIRVIYGQNRPFLFDMLEGINQDMISDYETRARFLVRPSS